MKCCEKRNGLKNCLGSLLIGAVFASTLFLSATTQVAAQELKPALAVTISSLEDVAAAVTQTASSLADSEGAEEKLAEITQMILGMPGADSKRPLGLAVCFADGAPVPMLFLPAKDAAMLADTLLAQVGGAAPVKKVAAGRYEITTPMGSLCIIAKDNWVKVAPSIFEDQLPKDPTTLLATPVKSTLGFSLDLTQVKREELDAILQPLLMIMMMQAAQQGQDVSSAINAIQTNLEIFFSNIESLFLGIKSEKNGDYIFSAQVTALADSEAGKAFAAYKNLKTPFAGFYQPKDAIMALCGVQMNLPSQREVAANSLKEAFSTVIATLEKEEDARAKIVSKGAQVLQTAILKTVDLENTFSAATWSGDGNFLAAMTLADAPEVLNASREIIKEMLEDGDTPEALRKAITLNGAPIEKYDTIRFATSFGELIDDESAIEDLSAEFLSQKIELILGAQDKTLCFAVSDGKAEAALKKAITASAKQIAIPEQCLVFDLAAMGKWLKTIKVGELLSGFEEIIDQIIECGDSGKIIGTQKIDGLTATASLTVKSGFVGMIAEIIALYSYEDDDDDDEDEEDDE